MRFTKIVTAFLTSENEFLILRRSGEVKSMKKLWAGVSGIIEKGEEPLARAKIEIKEEVGLEDNQIKLLKSASQMKILSPQYNNHMWQVFPFLFETNSKEIKLNWENSEYKWITIEEIKNYETVPDLEKVLSNLL